MRFLQRLGHHAHGVKTPSLTPLPHFAVVSSVHGVGPAGTFQYLPSKVSISSVQHFLTMRKFSSKARRFALSISSCWSGSAPWMPSLLRHDIDPAPLVAAREARIGAPARHVIEHGDVFGDADRIAGRQDDAELADADALGLHREVEVEQHRIVGELEALDVEVMLGEAHRIVAELVAEVYLPLSSLSMRW